MDIGLPVMDGIETCRRIKAELPQTHVVILAIHENPEYQADAMAAGASAYILKRKTGTELIPCLADLLTPLAVTDTGVGNQDRRENP